MRKPRLAVRVPKLCQRPDGRLYATDPALKKQVYFASQAEYEDWRGEFLARAKHLQAEVSAPPEPPPTGRTTVARFTAAFMDHARSYYRKDHKPTSQVSGFRAVVDRLNRLHGDRSVNTLRPRDIEAVLELLMHEKLVRRSINAMLRRIKTMFRWGVRKEFISGEVLGRVLSVEPLKKGRTLAREKPKVGPVDAATVEAILPHLKPSVRVMVQVQWYSGMRPGEICRLMPCEIDRSVEPWEYRPSRYKTEHRHEDDEEEKRRRIYFGPKCRELLEPWLKHATKDLPLFRSRACGWRKPSNYWSAVSRACQRANVPHFSPNQLRHSTATEVRRQFGAEAARVYLGHENLKTTEIYAEEDSQLAKTIAEKVG